MSIKTRKTLAKAVAAVIDDPRIGVPVLIDNQSGTAGINGQYASVGFPDSTGIGRDSQKFTNDTIGNVDLVETSFGFRELRFSIQVFRRLVLRLSK